MKWTRRDFLKSGVATSTGAASLLPATGAMLNGKDRSAPFAEQPGSVRSPRERALLDFGWRFHLGNADDPSKDFGFDKYGQFEKTGDFFEPCRPDFDDEDWRAINIPHDWEVELPFHDDPRLKNHGFKPLGRNYPATSIGWYRRLFEIPVSDLGRRLSLEFDGVFRNSMVALNGNFLGRNMSGYAPFRYDITDDANYGGKNILVVRVDATEFEGWWYEGAGIYRHVWLVKTSPIQVPQWGTFVTSEVEGPTGTLKIHTEVANESNADANCEVISTILDCAGKTVATVGASLAISAWRRRKLTQRVTVQNPELWSIETPRLYKLVTTVQADGVTLDQYETPFGIRSIRFDADKGFFLNGKRVEIRGTCNHQDFAGVGTALPDRLQYYRVERLKAMGVNGWRMSHNPPAPELLDACDRLGILVMDETRMFSSCPQGLSQLGRMLQRDRNHPCVVLWSTGNEEPEQGSARGARICASMKRLVRRLDPTRPITQAMNSAWGKGVSAVVDVQGFNYNLGLIDAFHRQFPKKPCIGTEVASGVSTRGIYFNDPVKGYIGAYNRKHPQWASTAEQWWQFYDARPFLGGGHVWTGFDYRGEPTPSGWPCISSQFGILDTCGFPKDIFYYYQAWWTGEPVLHILPHWNWPAKKGHAMEVWCYSNLEKIEILLNGKSLGTQKMPRSSRASWKVHYTPGILEARGYRDGRLVLTAKRETTGAAAKILLQPDRKRISADGEDVSVISVSVIDMQGRVVPVADNAIVFQVSGPGKVIGVGNGDPSSHEADKASRRRAFNGFCVAIIQATKQAGDVELTATSPGLASATAMVRCEMVATRPAVA